MPPPADSKARVPGVGAGDSRTTTILGLDFFNGGVSEAVELCREGMLVVVPSAPVLVAGTKEEDLYHALAGSDMAIADSSYMAFLWKAVTGKSIRRISGFEFLANVLSLEELRERGSLFLVNPSQKEDSLNHRYLGGLGIDVEEEYRYVAPSYPKGGVRDRELMEKIERLRPTFVIINIGGGVQEILGHYLRRNLSYRPAIVCTGAAIAFFTGEQARIPQWAYDLGLAWLMRCLKKPSVFVPRYFSALQLAPIIWRYRDKSPHGRSSGPPGA